MLYPFIDVVFFFDRICYRFYWVLHKILDFSGRRAEPGEKTTNRRNAHHLFAFQITQFHARFNKSRLLIQKILECEQPVGFFHDPQSLVVGFPEFRSDIGSGLFLHSSSLQRSGGQQLPLRRNTLLMIFELFHRFHLGTYYRNR